MAEISPVLEQDTIFIGETPFSNILLMNNSLFPWIIMVPKKDDAIEIFDFDEEERKILIEETNIVATILKNIYWPDKINIATLGNIVPQFHMHIIARFKTDNAWPNPVWGGGSKPYDEETQDQMVEKLRNEFRKLEGFVTVANAP